MKKGAGGSLIISAVRGAAAARCVRKLTI